MTVLLSALQAAKVKQIDIAWNFMDLNKTTADTYIPLQEERLDFYTNVATIKSIIPQKDYLSITGIADDQGDLKVTIADDLETVAHQVLSYAKKQKLSSLTAEFQFSKWDVIHFKQPDVLPFVIKVVGILTPLLTDPIFMKYQITAAGLKTISDNATIYDTTIGAAGTNANDVSTANEILNTTISASIENIHQFKLLNAYFKKVNPVFNAALIKNTKTQYPATHPTGYDGHVYKAGVPVQNAKVFMVGSETAFVLTDINGYYIIVKQKVGSHTLQATLPTGETKTEIATAEYRHIESVDFNF